MNLQFILLMLFYLVADSFCERDYIITLTKFEPLLKDDQVFIFKDLSVKKHNRTTSYLGGALEITSPIDRTFTIEFQGFEWYRVEYRLSGGTMARTNFCKFIEDDKMFFKDIIAASNLPPTCDIPAGIYDIDGFMLDTEKFPEQFPGDEWKFEVALGNGMGEIISGFVVYVNVDHDAGVKNKD